LVCKIPISVTKGDSDRAQVSVSFRLRYLITACGRDDTYKERPVYVCAQLFD